MSRLSCTLLMVNAFAAAFVPICPEGTRHVGVHAPHQSTFRHRGFTAAPVSAGTAARSTPADAGPGLGEDSGEKTPSSADSAGIQLEKLSRRGTDFLSGSSWILKLDIGREDGTWMDARWGNSGQRVRAAVAVTLEPNGSVSILNDYQYGLQRRLPDAVGVGWTVAGKFPQERLKLELQHSGIDRETTGCDVDLPAGRLFLSITTLGNALSTRGGGLSIEQFRFFVRRERRIVGVFKADRIVPKQSAPP